MKIKSIELDPKIKKFKSKDEFCNRMVEEVYYLTKNNKIYSKNNDVMIKMLKYKNNLIAKNEKLDSLLEQSKIMKEDLNSKLNNVIEQNNKYRERLINLLKF